MAEAADSSGVTIDSSQRDLIKELDLLRREMELMRRENELMRREQTLPKNQVSVQDFKNSLPVYGENVYYPVEKWISDIEENCDLYGWNSSQMLLCARTLLRGTAKLWLDAQPIIKTWSEFKNELVVEFGKKVSSAKLHQQLTQRKKGRDESCLEYVLKMSCLAAQGNIEERALIQYIIDGIPDHENNKVILYNAKTVTELKTQLEVYEVMKAKMLNEKQQNKPMMLDEKRKPPSSKTTHCYNCGGINHKLKDCKFKNQGTKCFSCNEFGHVASKCPKREEQSRRTMQVEAERGLRKFLKQVHLNGVSSEALIDTGSSVNLITVDECDRIGVSKDSANVIKLNGLGAFEIQTLGSVNMQVDVDGESYWTEMHVVTKDAIQMKCLLGNTLLRQTELRITPEEIKLSKWKEEDFTLLITLDEVEEIPELELDHVQDRSFAKAVKKIVKDYRPNPRKVTQIQTKIILKDETPISHPPRRLSTYEKGEVEKHVEEWIRDGIVRPSNSEFSSPVVLTKKKNGSTRLCVDYRSLNKQVIKDRYPLPLIEDQLDKLQQAKVFSVIDLRNGFFHVPVEKESWKYTAFVTHSGQYEFLKTPFGYCNSPSIFQRFINDVFKELIKNGTVVTYLDDLVITSKDEKEGLARLEKVLTTAQEYGLEINWKKCQFLHRKVEYLGHEVEDGQIRPSTNKVNAVLNFPEPKTSKRLQSFLGLSGYFRKFIPNYSLTARPLSELLKKDAQFYFGEEQRAAFKSLKLAMIGPPVLRIFQLNADTELHTDACKYGIAAILMQRCADDEKFHPVYYYSRKTSPAEQNYTSYELEVLAIIKGLSKFRVYLAGMEFKIVTDCSAFQMTMSKKELITRIARWAMYLEEFHYTIQHRPGSSMKHVDALSRSPVMIIDHGLLSRVRNAQRKDESLKPIFTLMDQGQYEDYVMEHEILYKNVNGSHLLVIPKGMQAEIIRSTHENGHFGVKKLKESIVKDYWIANLENKISQVIQNCIPCIISTAKRGKQECYLTPIVKETPLHTYHVDHLGPIPSTHKNYRYLFVVVDAFTKFVWIYPTKTTATKEVLERLKHQQSIFGNRKQIVSDRGTAFTSNDFEQYCADEDIRHLLITTGVPRGNGQVERVHQIIISMLT